MKETIKAYIDEIIYDDTPIERKIAAVSTVLGLTVFGIIAFLSYHVSESISSLNNYYYYFIGIIAIVPTIIVLISRVILFNMYNKNPDSFISIMKIISDFTDIIFVVVLFILLVMYTKDELSSGEGTSMDLIYTLWEILIIALIVVVMRFFGRRKRWKIKKLDLFIFMFTL